MIPYYRLMVFGADSGPKLAENQIDHLPHISILLPKSNRFE